MDFDLQPTLTDGSVVLRPLVQDDFQGLYAVASDPLLWEQHQNKDRYKTEIFLQFFKESMKSRGCLVVIDKKVDKIIGSTRFKTLDRSRGAIEIGWSFLDRAYWGGSYNRKVKKLTIDHALQAFGMVVFYVDAKNFRSQRAMEKLGAKRADDFSRPWVLPREKGITYFIDETIE